MKSLAFFCVALQLFAAVGLVSAKKNSGIYHDDHSVKDVIHYKREPVDPALTAYSRELLERSIPNGERLRRGMPLLAPSRTKRRPAAVYPRASPANGPCSFKATGKLAVYDGTGTVLQGYVRKTFDGQNSYTKTSNTADALTVQLPGGAAAAGPFKITTSNGPDPSHNFFGAVGGSGGYNFKANQLGYAYLSGTGNTPAGSPPSFSAGHSIQALGYNAPAESTIYSINCQTRQISAIWVNVDETTSNAQFMYDPSVDFLSIVGDYAKFVSTFPGEGAVIQTLFFDPDA
jgi:hypothetical protein